MTPDQFLRPVDKITEDGAEQRTQVYVLVSALYDLNYADGLALLAEMLEILVLSLEVMGQE